ncbi:MAG: hypothetical protein AB7T06_19470 [Kofleriaceae bacterium]
MANQRTTFLKRQREADRNDKQKAKEQRLAAARSGEKTTKGPQIAWDEAVTEHDSALTSDKPVATGGNLSSPNANSNNTAGANASRPATAQPAPSSQRPSPAPAKPAPAPAPAKPPVKR